MANFIYPPDLENGPQPEKAIVPKYPPKTSVAAAAGAAGDPGPQLQLGFRDPNNPNGPGVQPQPLSADEVAALMANQRPPEAAAGSGGIGLMGPPAPAQPPAQPRILNGPDAVAAGPSASPQSLLDQRQNALLKSLGQGGLSASGQYYTPMADLYGQLGQIDKAKSIGIEQQKMDLAKQQSDFAQSGDRNLEMILKQMAGQPGATGSGMTRAARDYQDALSESRNQRAETDPKIGVNKAGGGDKKIGIEPQVDKRLADELEQTSGKFTDPKTGLNADAYLSKLYQEKGPAWMKANKDAILKTINTDQIAGVARANWLTRAGNRARTAVGGTGAVDMPVGETLQRLFSSPDVKDQRNEFLRKEYLGLPQ